VLRVDPAVNERHLTTRGPGPAGHPDMDLNAVRPQPEAMIESSARSARFRA
jgi:hypothetical protein